MSMGQLAERVGVSSNHMSEVSRGRKNMSPRVQSRVEAALDAPVKVEPAEQGDVDPRALWDRMDAHSVSPERGGPPGRHQLRLPLPDHERPAQALR